MISYAEIINRIKPLDIGTTFILKDLFTGIEWNSIDTKTRRAWGTRLLSEVHENMYPYIHPGEKTSANAQIYIKTIDQSKWIKKVAQVIYEHGYISEYQDDNHKIHDIDQNKDNLNLLKNLKNYCKNTYEIKLMDFSAEIIGDGWSTIIFDENRYDHQEVTQKVQSQFNIVIASEKQFEQIIPRVPTL